MPITTVELPKADTITSIIPDHDALIEEAEIAKIVKTPEGKKVLEASGAEVTDDDMLVIKDPKKNANTRIETIQALLIETKNRNNPNLKERQAQLKESIEQYILFISACINNNLIENDITGILEGDAKNKYFPKSVGHVNSIAKAFLAKQSKIASHEGAKLSQTELAKLIETPYNYKPIPDEEDTAEYNENNVAIVDEAPEVDGENVVKINCVDGSEIIVDKNDASMYVESTTPSGENITFKRKVTSRAYTWFETARNIASSILGFVWDIFASFGVFALSLVSGTVGTIHGSTVGLASNVKTAGSTMFSGMRNSYKNAKSKAQANGFLAY